jgi:anhydro-N-acetylmuramic acid kinase
MKKPPVIAMGLMSGTSVDGIDASIVKINGKAPDELLFHRQFPYAPKVRQEILSVIHDPSIKLEDFTRLHYEIGSAFADAAEQALQSAKKILKRGQGVNVIGAHGQTVFHGPEGRRTLQIGEASLIVARTGLTTVSDFRTADTALGGEGAPLLPYYHRQLFAKKAAKGVAVHNLGGISNYTYMGPKNSLFALDTGPANCLLDVAIQKLSQGKLRYDEGGKLASSGQVDQKILSRLMEHPEVRAFRKKPAPKSSGRELFSAQFLEQALTGNSLVRPENLLRTLSEFTVALILESYRAEILERKRPLREVILAGGGTKNTFLLSLLRERMPSVKFHTMEERGWNSQALESQAFATFAWLALLGRAITFPSTTGAKLPAICGKISPGENWASLTR